LVHGTLCKTPEHLEWSFDTSEGDTPYAKWFADGRTNICYNALDRHVEAGHGDRVAFIAERNDPAENSSAHQPEIYTYSEALDEVCRIANALTDLGVMPGDRVALFMPMVSELPLAMLACARIGAVHSVVLVAFQLPLWLIAFLMPVLMSSSHAMV